MADGRVAIPAGAQAIGSVTLVERGGKIKERARLGVRFHTLVLADGTELPISTEAIYREGEPPAGESTRKIGGAAVGGAILGALIGGKKGAIVGATTGAAGGTAVVMAGDRNAATLPDGYDRHSAACGAGVSRSRKTLNAPSRRHGSRGLPAGGPPCRRLDRRLPRGSRSFSRFVQSAARRHSPRAPGRGPGAGGKLRRHLRGFRTDHPAGHHALESSGVLRVLRDHRKRTRHSRGVSVGGAQCPGDAVAHIASRDRARRGHARVVTAVDGSPRRFRRSHL